MEDVDSFCYLVLHEACKNLPGILAAQAAHAAQECIQTLPVSNRTGICVLESSTSDKLVELSKKLTEAGVPHCLNVEPDAPWNGAATALCTSPAKKSVVQPFFVGFEVMRKWPKK